MLDEENGFILVIDDEPESAALLRKCLTQAGHRVVVAGTTTEGWNLIERESIVLVVLDYRLRGKETGIEFLRRLRAAGKPLPAVIVSAFGNEQIVVEAFHEGASDYVPKTAAIVDQLPRVVGRVLDQLRYQALRRRAEEERLQLVRSLNERVKEMTLLQRVSRCLQDSEVPAEQLFPSILDAIPAGFFFPDLTSARICLGKQCWTTAEFNDDGSSLRRSFTVPGEPNGTLEVFVSRNAPVETENAFLPEEATLLDSLAEMLTMYFGRRSASEQMRQSERRYRSLIEATSLIVWKADAEGKISSLIPLLETPTDSESRQSLGDGWVQLVHPDDVEHTFKNWQKSVQDKQPHFASFRIKRHNGQIMHVESRGVPVLDARGNAIEWIGTLHDVSERVESQAVYSRLAAIVASTDDAVIGKTLDGTILSWNPGAERLYGYRAEEVLGSPGERIIPEPLREEYRDILRRIGEGQRVRNVESVRMRKNGTLIDVSVSVSPVLDKSGRVIGISAISRDISSFKAAERRRRAQSGVLQSIAGAATIEEAARGFLEALCNCYAWDAGCFWIVNESKQHLRSTVRWFREPERTSDFDQLTADMALAKGKDLPGEAWERSEPIWVVDFNRQPHFSRSQLANVLNWRGALAFPLQIGPRSLGVVEFFDRDVRRLRSDDLAVIGSLCTQLALVMERKEVESSRTRLATILEASTDLVSIADAAGNVLYMNVGGRRMLGLPDDAPIVGTHASSFHPGWAWKLLAEVGLPAAIEQGAWTGETAVKTAEAHEKLVSQLVLSHKDASGKVEFLSTTIRDMSQQKQDEESLRLHRRAVGAVSEGIMITGSADQECPILFANDAFYRMTGYEPSQVLGRNGRFLQGPETDPNVLVELRNAIRNGDPCSVEMLNYRADGTTFWNLLSITPVRDDEGRITHFVGTMRDISERKHMEAQIRQTQKMEAVGNLAGGIAHDFNNMLTIILGYGEMTREAIEPTNPAHAMLDEVNSAAKRAATLTGQLLAFSRRQVIELRQVEINALIADLQRLLRPLITENIAIATSLAPDAWPIRVDRNQFEQIVLNLVINARDAMPDGGRITIRTYNACIDEHHARLDPDLCAGEYVVLSVADTGVGMSQEVMGRVFEPFFTTKPKGKGTGMGLATVYGSVKQSNGHITVDSEPGHGTIFRVYLPRCTSADATAHSSDGFRNSYSGKETVLLVEDENGVREFANQVLAGNGYQVLTSEQAETALTLAEQFAGKIDLLVTDVVMPGLSGRQLADKLLHLRPDLKVLYISGYTDDVVVRHGVLDSETDFLQKPFSRDSLSRKVRHMLDRRG